jgi:RimK-like ATP-grasp domain
VAAGEIVGAVKRVAAPGEWRTNIALGGGRCPVALPPHACLIALGAASALGTDLVGVDLLPDGDGGWVVLELNGAVDFTPEYSLGGESVFERVVQVLAHAIPGDIDSSSARVSKLSGERSRGCRPPGTRTTAVAVAMSSRDGRGLEVKTSMSESE